MIEPHQPGTQGRVRISTDCLISSSAFIIDQIHNVNGNSLIRDQGCSASPIIVGKDARIGSKAFILPGVTLAKGSVVAAEAVINKNVEAMTIVAGVPAKPIGKRKGLGK